MADDKTYIIDPLTSVCKVALLDFMPDGTKLAIDHHTLRIHEYTYTQWLERMKNGDSRRDISNLNAPFLKAIKWYILDGEEKANIDDELGESIRTIMFFTVKGLKKLQNFTYQDDIGVKIILQYFVNLFTDALNDIWREESIVKINDGNSIVSGQIKNNYNADNIKQIAAMLTDASKMEKSHKDVQALINCSHELLKNRDAAFVDFMEKINRTRQ